VELKPPPQRLFEDSAAEGMAARTMFASVLPDASIALAARVKIAGEGVRREAAGAVSCARNWRAGGPVQRLAGRCDGGDGALFTREDAVEAAWAVVDPVLKKHRARVYKRGTWGPKEANALLGPGERWHNPGPDAGGDVAARDYWTGCGRR
jgi:glucose-6-phosphate 1-dehydrogenase